MNRNIISLAALALTVGVSSVSCVSRPADDSQAQADAYAVECERVAAAYRDSIKLARDSATVLRLSENMAEAITNIGYRYPADIYLQVSESHNESISRLTLRMVELRDSILYRLAHPLAAADTVAADSVAAAQTMSNKPVDSLK